MPNTYIINLLKFYVPFRPRPKFLSPCCDQVAKSSVSLARRLDFEDDQNPAGGSEAAGGSDVANGVVSWLDLAIMM